MREDTGLDSVHREPILLPVDSCGFLLCFHCVFPLFLSLTIPPSPPSFPSLSSPLWTAPPGMLLKPKYGRFRNDSVTSSDDLMQSLAMSGKVVATPVASLSTQGLELPPLETAALSPPSAQVLADSPGLDGEQDGTTTFCMLIPKMPHWKFSNSLLSRSPSNSSSSSGSSKDSGRAHTADTSAPASGGATAASGPVASLAAVFNSCDPVCVGPCSLQAIRRHRVSGNSASLRDSSARASEGSPGGSGSSRTGMNRRTRVEGIWLGDNFTQKGSFMNKPSQGWLHPDKKISSTGASYIVRVSVLYISSKSNCSFRL